MEIPKNKHALSRPIIGLIGGMGSLATIETYSRLMSILPVELRHVLIDNLPIENVFDNLHDDTFLNIIYSAQRLADSGVRVIAIPCNTVHCYSKNLIETCKKNGVTFVSIIEKTVEECIQRGLKNVSVLATPTGLNIYSDHLKSAGIRCIPPSEREQNEIDQIIRDVLRINRNKKSMIREKVTSIGDAHIQNHNADAIVLACTELPVLFSGHLPPHYLSTIDVLSASLRKEAEKHSKGLKQCA